MQKYEYKTFVYETKGLCGGTVDANQFEDALNNLGNEGWEMVSGLSTTQGGGSSKSVVCILKRKKD